MKIEFLLPLLFIIAFAQDEAPDYVPDPTKWRPIDGYGVNTKYPTWGTPNIRLERKGFAVFDDGISSPRMAENGNALPSPRLISDNVFAMRNGVNPKNRRGLTDFVTYWGQFIDHDFSNSAGDPNGYAEPLEPLAIPVPSNDQYFDPQHTGLQNLPFFRGIFDNTTQQTADNPRTPINLVTAWMDGSQIYGSDAVTATAIRTLSGGLLKSQIINGAEYPVFNNGSTGVTMQTAYIASQDNLFLFGDVRGNENPGLTVLQIIFLREHNRRARELASMYGNWTDEQLYQESRKFVVAIIQHITEEEYLPVTLGEHFEEYKYWLEEEAPNIYVDFSTGAFRYGHSEVNSNFPRLFADGTSIPQGPLYLMNSYFNPINSILSAGVDPIVRGMLQNLQGAVDVTFVDDLRNYLFGAPGSGGMDLTAINIQRGRDHGLPGFNQFRDNYGLPAYTSWDQINPDPAVWQALAATYNSIDDCDIYVCGLAETPYTYLSNVGQTFHAAIKEQYHRLRDSDPFWYEADGYLTPEEEYSVRQTTLAELIRRNTGLQQTEIQCLAMSLPDGCSKAVNVNPTQPYDFVVTLQTTTPNNPLFGLENDLTYSINGVNGASLTLQRGRSYTFFVQASCSHAFYIATTPDITVPPFAPAYSQVTNNMACLQQNPYVTVTLDNSTPNSLFYACALHNFMGGNITVVGFVPGSSVITLPKTSAETVAASTSAVSSSSASASATAQVNVEVGSPAIDTGARVALGILIPVLAVIIIALVVVVVILKRRNSTLEAHSHKDTELERRNSKVGLES